MDLRYEANKCVSKAFCPNFMLKYTQDVLQRHSLQSITASVAYDDGYEHWNIAFKVTENTSRYQYTCIVLQCESRVNHCISHLMQMQNTFRDTPRLCALIYRACLRWHKRRAVRDFCRQNVCDCMSL